MGRRWWCACGEPTLWVSDTFARHNSQHLLDPYSATHFLHGIMFYALVWTLARRSSHSTRMSLALLLETLWEIAENSSFVIDRYRQETGSVLYYGDTIVNSVADLGLCAAGYLFASRVKASVSVACLFLTEMVLVLTIHDSLIINIWLLTWPTPALKAWQLGQ